MCIRYSDSSTNLCTFNIPSPEFSPCVLPMFWLPLLFFPCRRLPARHHGLRRAQPNLQCEQTQTLWTYFRLARADHQDVRVGLKHIQASASAGGGSSDNWPWKRGTLAWKITVNVLSAMPNMSHSFVLHTFLFQELQQLKTDLEQVLALTQDLINAQLGASAGIYQSRNFLTWGLHGYLLNGLLALATAK